MKVYNPDIQVYNINYSTRNKIECPVYQVYIRLSGL
jgi:hypothetical protein